MTSAFTPCGHLSIFLPCLWRYFFYLKNFKLTKVCEFNFSTLLIVTRKVKLLKHENDTILNHFFYLLQTLVSQSFSLSSQALVGKHIL